MNDNKLLGEHIEFQLQSIRLWLQVENKEEGEHDEAIAQALLEQMYVKYKDVAKIDALLKEKHRQHPYIFYDRPFKKSNPFSQPKLYYAGVLLELKYLTPRIMA